MKSLRKIWADLADQNLASLFLRIGLAFVFIYAATAAFLAPRDWIGFLPTILTNLIDADILLKLFSLFELSLAVWLLSGVYVRWAGLVTAIMMIGIVVVNPSVFIVSFRDVGLAFAGLALACIKDKTT